MGEGKYTCLGNRADGVYGCKSLGEGGDDIPKKLRGGVMALKTQPTEDENRASLASRKKLGLNFIGSY